MGQTLPVAAAPRSSAHETGCLSLPICSVHTDYKVVWLWGVRGSTVSHRAIPGTAEIDTHTQHSPTPFAHAQPHCPNIRLGLASGWSCFHHSESPLWRGSIFVLRIRCFLYDYGSAIRDCFHSSVAERRFWDKYPLHFDLGDSESILGSPGRVLKRKSLLKCSSNYTWSIFKWSRI